ncbi:MAG: exodeoxyribonuclease VII small subunit [Hyphomonadaceae bacterium]|nr:exodeoxyribonuclease VII small subunit [Hyphomonadaceae bacterium]
MASKTATAIESMSFETALSELEQIVSKLERGDVELEESIAIYERGAQLKAHCEARLKAAELKVEQIVQDSSGTPRTEPANLD